jgi:hypothetical protein
MRSALLDSLAGCLLTHDHRPRALQGRQHLGCQGIDALAMERCGCGSC